MNNLGNIDETKLKTFRLQWWFFKRGRLKVGEVGYKYKTKERELVRETGEGMGRLPRSKLGWLDFQGSHKQLIILL